MYIHTHIYYVCVCIYLIEMANLSLDFNENHVTLRAKIGVMFLVNVYTAL